MAAITIAGIALDCPDGSEGEPTLIGEVSDSFSGIERNSVRGQKRNFTFTTVPTLEATWDSLRAAIAQRAQVTVSGLILSGDTITASVVASAKPNAGDPGYFIITGSVRQVAPV